MTVGRIIAERYELLSPLNEGGMGLLYVALQRTLKRRVALKLIRPGMTSVHRVADRFLLEAQSASQLNHPNVVSIYDFGQTTDGATTELFLVMELLSGSDLRALIETEVRLSPAHIVDILRQTLAGLAEAHDHGITHRDIKPENIFLERRRRGDVVKLIDFGVARVERDVSLTLAGQFVGTPSYSAPEQIRGESGPSVDLYAVGVVLYELLTGELPFDAPSAVQILVKHQSAPRPDPSKHANGRDVPRALADVCMRAMAIDPAHRYPTAEALSDALAAAVESPSAVRRGSMFPRRARRSSLPAPTPPSVPAKPETLPDPIEAFGKIDSVVPAPEVTPSLDALPRIGRDEELAWIVRAVRAQVPCVLVHGRAGVGRTRLLRAASERLAEASVVVCRVESPVPPLNQVADRMLRDLILALTGLTSDELASGRAAPEPAATGVRFLFAGAIGALAPTRDVLSAALTWAATFAVAQAGARRVAVLIDDVDQLDGGAMLAIGDAIEDGGAGVSFVMTSLRPPSGFENVEKRELRGFGGQELASWREHLSTAGADGNRVTLPSRDIEPLYLEHVWFHLDDDPLPESLDDLVSARVRGLLAAERRVLQALAVTGAATETMLATVLDEELQDGRLEALCDARLVEVRSGVARIKHRIIADTVLALSPAGTTAALHGRAADALADDPTLIELRAYHSVRGQANFETFMLVEEATRRRVARGDHDGAIALLMSGLEAASTQSRRGDVAAESARAVFGRKIGMALMNAGRFDEGIDVLEMGLRSPSIGDAERALSLEQLAIAYASVGRQDEATRRQNEALIYAQDRGDTSMIRRLSVPPSGRPSRPAPRLAFKSSVIDVSLAALVGAPAPTSQGKPFAVSESIARRRDPRREED
jgi:serine/threonine protein kinase